MNVRMASRFAASRYRSQSQAVTAIGWPKLAPLHGTRITLNCSWVICCWTKAVSEARSAAAILEGWYQITIPPCSRLWSMRSCGCAVLYTPHGPGESADDQCGPDVAGMDV